MARGVKTRVAEPIPAVAPTLAVTTTVEPIPAVTTEVVTTTAVAVTPEAAWTRINGTS